MRAAAAVRAGPVEPSVYLTSGRKEYFIGITDAFYPHPSQFTLQTEPSKIGAITSGSTTIGKRLNDDKFFLGEFLLRGTDENVHFCQPFFLYEVRCCGSATVVAKCSE